MEINAWAEHAGIQETYWWHVHKREFLLHLAEQKPYRRVLEIGTGGGRLTDGLKCPALRITMDLSVRHVRPGGVVAGLPRGCFKSGVFDLVILSDVLEHLDQPVEALKTVRRIMTEDGRCLITVPAWPSLWSSHDIFYGHKKRYTPSTLRAELLEAGFRMEKKGWIFFMPLWAVFVLRAVRIVGENLGVLARPDAPQSRFVLFPAVINRLCLTYLRWIEQPLAVRWRLPVGATLAAVAVRGRG